MRHPIGAMAAMKLQQLIPPRRASERATGSMSRRMITVAALLTVLLIAVGGYAVDRVSKSALTSNFNAALEFQLNSLIQAAEIGPDGEVFLNRGPADQRFLEPYSGLYYQISGDRKLPDQQEAVQDLPSRSLWDRNLKVRRNHRDSHAHFYESQEFPNETLRIVERDAILPASPVRWRFQVAQNRIDLDEQIAIIRSTLIRYGALLGLALIALAGIQAFYGLWPLRRVRQELAAIRSGKKARIEERFPNEIEPLAAEVNELLAHVEMQAEEARRHAGNLAHALKTPLTVLTNAATAHAPDLVDTVCREATTMRRQIDHHLARARAIGRRASAQARADVWPSLEAVERAVARLHEDVTVDLAGDKEATVRVERQDLDEMVGNLIENAAKYGNGRVFVTVKPPADGFVEIEVEDDGPGIPESERAGIFDRGARLDIDKPGTGLGLAIVRDVGQIYGGSIGLEESEDLGGLLARLRLPAA
jgi:signal transduction histidine kinase